MSGDEATFEDLREHLFGIVYRMVGRVAVAEDLVQEAWLRWASVEDQERITSPRAYLTTVVTRLAMKYLSSAQVRRETYVGPWLPEPLVTEFEAPASEPVELRESVALAFMVLMEALTPRERAVFVLHVAFAVPHARVAEIMGTSEANSRQILHRARARVEARQPWLTESGSLPFETRASSLQALMERFMEATASGDLEGLTELLARDAVAITDGGGEAPAARRPVHGRIRVARFVVGAVSRFVPRSTESRLVRVNGLPGVLTTEGRRPVAVVSAEARRGRMQTLFVITNPRKLERSVVHPQRDGASGPATHG